MSNSSYIKSALAEAALKLIPPAIRDTLLEEPEFRQKYNIKVETTLTFGDSGFSVYCSELFDSIRKVLSGAVEHEVTDASGQVWKLRNEARERELPILVVSSNGQRVDLPDFSMFSPDVAIRMRSFNEVVYDVNLPPDVQNIWEKVLVERALKDDEFDPLKDDFIDTPVQVARLIRNKIETSSPLSVPCLVPCSRKYFDRLVGVYDGSDSIGDYAAKTGRQFLEQLSAWKPYEGFLFSLFLATHSSIAAEISVEHLSNEELLRAFSFLEKQGDSISRLGAVEIGLRILPNKPIIEPHIIQLIKHIRNDAISKSVKEFDLLSALFILVDGELSRTRMMSTEPPFFRRLASLAQAALIHRQLVDTGIDETFCKWALGKSSERFHMQSFADMHLEPSWNPSFATADQLKEEFFGRIMIAAVDYKDNIKNNELHELIFGTASDSIQSLSSFPYAYLPGPLDGLGNIPRTMPAELSQAIEDQLDAENMEPSSFTALVNSAMIFQVDTNHAELAAQILRLGNHRLRNVTDKAQLFAILHGLAIVAAMGRNFSLADELRILMRRHRHETQYDFSVEDEMRICLLASASREDLDEWRKFVGDWLTELSFEELGEQEGAILLSHLRCLCNSVPDLWVFCGRADAALTAFNSR